MSPGFPERNVGCPTVLLTIPIQYIVSMISRTLFFSRIHGAVLRSLHVMFSMILSRALCIVLSFKAFCFVRFQVSDPKVTIVGLTDRKPDL